MNKYLYSVLRFVPDAASGEFINIGAIAGSDEEASWEIRTVSNQKRASGIDSNGVLGKVIERASALQREVAEAELAIEDGLEPRISEAWLRGLHRTHEHLLQFSEPTPMMAASAAEALDLIFRELVTDPGVRAHEFRTKRAAFSVLLNAYKKVGLEGARAVRQRPVVRGAHHVAKFDFAVANGHAVQLANAWSFETPKLDELVTEVKAWAWAVQDLRRSGGALAEESGGTLEVPSDVDIEVVYLPPTKRSGEEARAEALSAFADANVKARARPESEVSLIASEALQRLRQSELGL